MIKVDANIQNTKELTKIEIDNMEIKGKIYRGFKRITDIVLGCVGLVLLSPVFLMFATFFILSFACLY